MDKIAVLIPCYNESQTIGRMRLRGRRGRLCGMSTGREKEM